MMSVDKVEPTERVERERQKSIGRASADEGESREPIKSNEGERGSEREQPRQARDVRASPSEHQLRRNEEASRGT